jgi:hypothetical protein
MTQVLQGAVNLVMQRLAPAPFREAGVRSTSSVSLPYVSLARAFEAYEAAHMALSSGLSDSFERETGRDLSLIYNQTINDLNGRRK